MRADRYAASAVADMARLADAQDAWQDSEHSKQARAVGIMPSPAHGGRTGWRVGNSSDYAVTTVRVRTTTGAKVSVYCGSGPDQGIPSDNQGGNVAHGCRPRGSMLACRR
jgi:hypothetical protein